MITPNQGDGFFDGGTGTSQNIGESKEDLVFSENQQIACPTELAGSKILLADDSESARNAIAKELRDKKYEVTEVGSGFEALSVAGEVDPDLILLEIAMEGLDGLVVCESLKQDPRFEDIPVIFLTKVSDKNFVVRGLHAGAADYITKPFDSTEALARIHNHLKMRHMARQMAEANQKMAQSNKALEKANKAMAEANKAKSNLLSVTTHDLKNPLISIKGIAEFLLSEDFGSLCDEQKEMLKQITDASEGALDMVRDLLFNSLIESQNIKIEKDEHMLSDFVASSVKLCQVNACRKNISIKFHDATRCSRATYDERLLRRVLQNLVGNAIKFSPQYTEIKVLLTQDENAFTVHVKDEGPGIPESEQHKLFQDYSRTSIKPTGDEMSTGLGLSICRKIIEAHSGLIGMENISERGSDFYFSIPIPGKNGKRQPIYSEAALKAS